MVYLPMGVTRSGTGCKICGLEPTSWAVRFISNSAGLRPGLETAGTGATAAAATAAAAATTVAPPLAAVDVVVVVGDSLNLVHWLASLVDAATAPPAATDPVAAAAVVVGFSTFGELEILRVLIGGGVICVTVTSPRLELLLLA